MSLVMRAVRAERHETDALRSLLGRPLDAVQVEDLSWLPPEERAAGERAGYLEIVLVSGETGVSLHPEEFLTPLPYPRAKLFRPVALVVGADEHTRWRETLRAQGERARSGREQERVRRHLESRGAVVARDLGPVAEVSALKALFWPRRTKADDPDFEWRFLNPRDAETLELATSETAALETDVAVTEYDLGLSVATAGGRELAVSADKLLELSLDGGLGRFGGIVAPEPV
jgi:hypothetical protein